MTSSQSWHRQVFQIGASSKVFFGFVSFLHVGRSQADGGRLGCDGKHFRLESEVTSRKLLASHHKEKPKNLDLYQSFLRRLFN